MKRAALATGATIGVPVYFVIEALVRLLNVGRSRMLSHAELEVVDLLDSTDLSPRVQGDAVRIVTNARLPIKQRAITLGNDIFIKGDFDVAGARDRELLAHELVHVAQRHRHGRVGMAWHYAACFCDGFSYRDHEMEIEARAIAAHAVAEPGD